MKWQRIKRNKKNIKHGKQDIRTIQHGNRTACVYSIRIVRAFRPFKQVATRWMATVFGDFSRDRVASRCSSQDAMNWAMEQLKQQ